MKSVAACLVLATLASGAFATPKTAPAKYVVHERTAKGLVPVGEIARGAGGAITVTPLAAPALDAMTTKLVAEWSAYEQPASVKVTQHIAAHTGMQPQYVPHTFTFTDKDKLYKAAVIREFLEKRGYVATLGMEVIKFVEFDSSAEYPPMAHDRASTRSNFRKGTDPQFHGGRHSFYIGKEIRPKRSPGAGRISASDKAFALAVGYDDGTLELARMDWFEDGKIVVTPVFAKDRLERAFPATLDDVTVRTIVKEAWMERVVPKDSPRALEAAIVTQLEYMKAYEIKPVIDPATL